MEMVAIIKWKIDLFLFAHAFLDQLHYEFDEQDDPEFTRDK